MVKSAFFPFWTKENTIFDLGSLVADAAKVIRETTRPDADLLRSSVKIRQASETKAPIRDKKTINKYIYETKTKRKDRICNSAVADRAERLSSPTGWAHARCENRGKTPAPILFGAAPCSPRFGDVS